MILFKKYLEQNEINSILQIDRNGKPLINIFKIIRRYFPNIWILVMNENKVISRYENKELYEVIYNSYDTYKYNTKFDIIFVRLGEKVDLNILRKGSKRIGIFTGENTINEELLSKIFSKVEYIYALRMWIENSSILSESFKLYLSKFKIFRNNSFKIIIGTYHENSDKR